MAGTPTVLSADNGAVSVPSSGEWTAQGIAQVQSLLNTTTATTIEFTGGTVPTQPSSGGPYVLEVPNGTNFGDMVLPTGYAAVIIGQQSSGSVSGGDGNTTILSAASVMSYSGGAGEFVQTATVPGATGTISDTLTGAVFDLGGGNYTISASGNQQTIQVDDSATVSGTISGSNDVIQLGEPSSPAGAAVAAASATTITNNLTFTGRGEVVTVNSFGNVIADSGGGSTTIAGITGSSTIFAANNDVYYGASAVTEFIASTGAQTVFGGSGNDTVFNAGAAVTYNEGSGSFNIAVNASGNMSVYGNGSGAVFGGSGATSLVLDTGNDVFVGGTGGSDSIYGGSVNPTLWGGSTENEVLVGSHFSFVVATGDNSSFNASLTTGGDNFFVTGSAGNTTLVASSGTTADTFNLQSVTGGAARTISVENWQNGDGLFLTNYDSADVQKMDQAIVGGATTFTLSDGTTVNFLGTNHPTHASGPAIF